ncbi:MAG TPA: vanadium-dependent haloperoxidase [Acidimicrobiales bacterium]|nr:vanadium-dependent haloperoxidase [Acidimicrobiales bacterium]
MSARRAWSNPRSWPRSRAVTLNRRVQRATCWIAALSILGVAPLRAEAAQRPRKANVVLTWNDAFLEGVRRSTLGPPTVSRALAIAHTCIYDAWAAYDRVAVGTQLGGSLRRPPRERIPANVEKAVSFAAYRAAADLFPESRAGVFDPLMVRLGYDPRDTSLDVSTPAGVGNRACAAVLEFRHHDGANQLGDHPTGRSGVAYSDYTGYLPANDPMDLSAPFDPSTVRDPSRWQPLRYTNASGSVVTQSFVGPFWNRVVGFALPSNSELRSSTGPAVFGSAEYEEQARNLLEVSARLTDREKVIAEYWADGPRTELPPGHWNLFAQYVSLRDDHGTGPAGVEADVKMFFALNNALFDAGIVAWDNKIAFDSVRPVTAIRYLFRGQKVSAWGGPYQGTATIDGEAWTPYQPTTFPTPPFGEYSSGHSNFSAAGAEILRLATGSDRFGLSVTVPAGRSRVEPGAVPAADVTLEWGTFKEAADEAGVSRRYGGIHFAQGDEEGRATGRQCAGVAWAKAQALFEGKG